MKSLGYLGAFLGGALAGVLAGILFAPEKGEVTRAKIKSAVEEFLEKHDIRLDKISIEKLVDKVAGEAIGDIQSEVEE